jgi:hypothetical protein
VAASPLKPRKDRYIRSPNSYITNFVEIVILKFDRSLEPQDGCGQQGPRAYHPEASGNPASGYKRPDPLQAKTLLLSRPNQIVFELFGNNTIGEKGSHTVFDLA